MKYYELNYLISPELSEQEAKQLQEKIISFIQKKEGVLEKEEKPVKKNLSYPIKKKETAYLACIGFHFQPQEIASLEKEIKSENQILRFLLLKEKLPKKTKAPLKISKKPAKPKEVQPKQKVKLKEIEEKLEEILKE